MNGLIAFATGLTFALGLGIGGLMRPTRVLGFLDVAGNWDPRLALVMAGAVITYGLLRRWIVRRGRPVVQPRFAVTSRTDLDAALIGGAVLFGIGWGLVGFCPGPAIVALGAAVPQAGIFVAAMVTGMLLYERRERARC